MGRWRGARGRFRSADGLEVGPGRSRNGVYFRATKPLSWHVTHSVSSGMNRGGEEHQSVVIDGCRLSVTVCSPKVFGSSTLGTDTAAACALLTRARSLPVWAGGL